MAAPTQSANETYLVSASGDRIPLKASVLKAIKRMLEQKATGKVILHFRSGGHAHTSDEVTYPDE
jgi:hypothetical protein